MDYFLPSNPDASDPQTDIFSILQPNPHENANPIPTPLMRVKCWKCVKDRKKAANVATMPESSAPLKHPQVSRSAKGVWLNVRSAGQPNKRAESCGIPTLRGPGAMDSHVLALSSHILSGSYTECAIHSPPLFTREELSGIPDPVGMQAQPEEFRQPWRTNYNQCLRDLDIIQEIQFELLRIPCIDDIIHCKVVHPSDQRIRQTEGELKTAIGRAEALACSIPAERPFEMVEVYCKLLAAQRTLFHGNPPPTKIIPLLTKLSALYEEIGDIDNAERTYEHLLWQLEASGHEDDELNVVVCALARLYHLSAGEISEMAEKMNIVGCTATCKHPALHRAMGRQNHRVVQHILVSGAERNAKGIWQKTVMHMTVEKCAPSSGTSVSSGFPNSNPEDVLAILLKHDLDLELGDESGFTVLQQACSSGVDVEIVKSLLKKGAEINSPFKGTALYTAAANGCAEIVEVLIKEGAEVGDDEFMTSALYAAVKGNHGSVYDILNRYGAAHDSSILCAAASAGNEYFVRKLLGDGIKADSKTIVGAAENGNETIINLLIQSGAVADSNSINRAAENGDQRTIEILIKNGATIDKDALVGAARNGHNSTVEYLLQHKIPLEAYGKALEEAAIHGHESLVKLIAEILHSRNDLDLFDAAQTLISVQQNGYDTIFDILYKMGTQYCSFDVSETLRRFHHKLNIAELIFSGEANRERLLAEFHLSGDSAANILLQAVERGREGVIRFLMEAGAFSGYKHLVNSMLLYTASGKGHEGILNLLLDAGAFSFKEDLTSASSLGHVNIVEVLCKHQEHLISLGLGVALVKASFNCHTSMIKALLSLGADPNAEFCGITALHEASSREFISVMRVLLESGTHANKRTSRSSIGIDKSSTPLQCAKRNG
ncbi:ankyrin repeat-containing domain protein [Trichophaea hybrida]|nr:ankyrin repeat-containing domain protein [Trichophaea hybrida]